MIKVVRLGIRTLKSHLTQHITQGIFSFRKSFGACIGCTCPSEDGEGPKTLLP